MRQKIPNDIHERKVRLNFLRENKDKLLRAYAIANALGFIETFKKGIKSKSFNLEPLHQLTIKRKQQMGLPLPKTPLYGEGERKEKSYINMFYLHPVTKGIKAEPKNIKHHRSDLKLKDLYIIHEYGGTWGGRTIPARPAGKLAFIRWGKGEGPAKISNEMQKAITKYARTGDMKAYKDFVWKYEQLFKQNAKAS